MRVGELDFLGLAMLLEGEVGFWVHVHFDTLLPALDEVLCITNIKEVKPTIHVNVKHNIEGAAETN